MDLRGGRISSNCDHVRAACRLLGVHHSTYYRWRRQLVRFGPELPRPRERRQPRMPNAIPPMVEQRILALALAYPGWGPDRLSLELGREKWGRPQGLGERGLAGSQRHGLNTRAKRLRLVCGYAAPPQPERPEPPPERHIEAKRPGHRVQFDNFYIGRLAGTAGVFWQYSACDVASSYTWTELHVSPKTPLPNGPPPWPDVSPRSSPSAAGSWRLSTRPSSAMPG